MSVFLTGKAGQITITLDAVENVNYSRNVNVSTTTMFNGAKISDHARSELPVVTFNGIVTRTKVDNQYRLSPTEFTKAMDTLVDSGELMSFYGTQDGAIPNLKRCYITNFVVGRDSETSDSIKVTISLQQLDINNALQKTTLYAPSQATDGQMASNPDNSKSGSKTENTAAVRAVLRKKGIRGVKEINGNDTTSDIPL